MRKVYPEDLTVRQIHYLLLEKRKIARHSRLDHFHRTGRVIPLVGEIDSLGFTSKSSDSSRTLRREKKLRTWLDHFLIVLEILAVIGLVAVVFTGLSTLGSLNQVFAAGMQQPTLEPTPLVQALVLPDGHTPPDAAGISRPNEPEIPEHLRPLWQSMASLPTPLPDAEQAIRIQIPAIGVDSPAFRGNSWEKLKRGVGQAIGTPNAGKKGNIVLAGHNDVYGEVFRYLDRLTPGGLVILYNTRRQFTYVITGTQMVEPAAVEVMAQTPDARVTLVSCHPYLIDDHRIVVSAVLQSR